MTMQKILVVDDEEPIRNLLKKTLNKSDYRCTLAANAAEARAFLKEDHFEVVLTDINMPGESGLDFIRYVRAEHPDTAAVIVSVMDAPSVIAAALEIGVHDYIVKPFHPKGVLISVKNVLQRRQLEIDNRAYRENLEQMVSDRTAALQKSKREFEQTLARLKDTQAHMIQSEKMASIGQLAAGVAHEINNPTGFVSSNLKTLSDYERDFTPLMEQYKRLVEDLKDILAREKCCAALSEQVARIVALEDEIDIDFILGDMKSLIEESREGTERIKKIVLDLKDFAHPGEDKLQSADINQCLESTLNVVWNELKYKATVTKAYGDLPIIQCYPHQLNQVFMNLLVNAAQAIERKGEIKIATRADNGHVEIEINDTGSGIPKENLPKIFDPFFTTKGQGKGTGLGLSTVYGIVKENRGTIAVKKTGPEGTTFLLELPEEKDVSDAMLF
jgi:two-component system NtrC family sensor kinase